MNKLPYAKKALGQHWLQDEASLGAMCDGAEVQAGDTVLEIGPGTGSLTDHLLDRGAGVVAVELDEDRAMELQQKYGQSDFELHMQSILKFDLSQLAPGYKVVANIPYYLTSHLFRLLSESSNPPSVAVLLVQKEVAERVSANPGGMSLLSITTQFYWEVVLGKVVPARLFTPSPKVDSQILVLRWRKRPLFADVDEKAFFRLIKAGFAARRKTLLNSLSGGLRIGKAETVGLLEAVGISPTARPQELSMNDWYALYKVWQK